jgi:hypothetical protein
LVHLADQMLGEVFSKHCKNKDIWRRDYISFSSQAS